MSKLLDPLSSLQTGARNTVFGVSALITAMIAAFCLTHFRGDVSLPIASSIALFASLIALSAIDIRTGLLPDWLTLPLIGLGLVHNWAIGNEIWPYALGGMAGYLVTSILSGLWAKFRGAHGIGLGDAKLLAAAGTWLGGLFLPMVMLIASGGGLLFVMAQAAIARKTPHTRTAIPFGPFLALGLWVMWCNMNVVLKL